MIAKPGDRIVITDPTLIDVYGRMCVVSDCDTVPYMIDNISNIIWAYESRKNHGGIFWIRHDSYIVIEDPNTVEVKVGDTIIVTNKGWIDEYCKTFTVIGIEDEKVQVNTDIYDHPWWLSMSSCKVIKRGPSTSNQQCQDCNGTGKIELLTSTVKCKCAGGQC